MSVEIRVPKEEELDLWFSVVGASFSDELKEEDKAHDRRMMPPDRMLAAYEDGAMIGTAVDFPLTLSIPGGELPASGLSMVGVVPSHRRRGVLTGLMRRHLDAALERDEPLSILWASEPPIYGRYGYGVATMRAWIEADRDRVEFRGSPEPTGQVRLVDVAEAERILPPLYERVRKETPGMFVRTPEWWREYRLPDPEHRRRGGGPRFIAVLEIDGTPEAYAMYRVHEKWPDGFPASRLSASEIVATSPLASREIWRFLFGVDLVARVDAAWLRVDDALLLLVTDPRRLRPKLSDGLWLRILDVERALGSRSYAAEGAIGLELRDSFVEDNDGVWTLEAGGGGTEVRRGGEAELRLDMAIWRPPISAVPRSVGSRAPAWSRSSSGALSIAPMRSFAHGTRPGAPRFSRCAAGNNLGMRKTLAFVALALAGFTFGFAGCGDDNDESLGELPLVGGAAAGAALRDRA